MSRAKIYHYLDKSKHRFKILKCYNQIVERGARNFLTAFTLVEVLISLVILAVVMAGIIYGYVQANRMAEWSCMSQAAQACATEGAEQARAAVWIPSEIYSGMSGASNGPGSPDELGPATPPKTLTPTTNILDIPIKGDPTTNSTYWVIDTVTLSDVSTNPPLRQIRSDAVWTFSPTAKKVTNTVILLRAADQ